MPKNIKVSHVSMFKDVLKGLNTIRKLEIYVGFPKSEKGRKEGGPLNNVTLAMIHDNGLGHNPKRSFMRPGIEENKSEINKYLFLGSRSCVLGQVGEGKKNFTKAAMKAQFGIIKYINDGRVMPPLANSTIIARRRVGIKGTYPLLATKQMRIAVKYVIKGI